MKVRPPWSLRRSQPVQGHRDQTSDCRLRAQRSRRGQLDRLAKLQDSLTKSLERIGRRDRLAVTWAPRGDHVTSSAALLANLMTPEGRATPYPHYAAAHELGPVSWVADGYLLVAGHDAINEVLRSPGFGLAEPLESVPATAGPDTSDALRSMAKSILRANPPDHGRMRSLISQVFTPRRVATLQPTIEAAVDHLLDRLAATARADTAIDFMDAFRLPAARHRDLRTARRPRSRPRTLPPTGRRPHRGPGTVHRHVPGRRLRRPCMVGVKVACTRDRQTGLVRSGSPAPK